MHKQSMYYWKTALLLAVLAVGLGGCNGDGNDLLDDTLGFSDGKEIALNYHIAQSEIDYALSSTDRALVTATFGGRVAGTEDLYCANFIHNPTAQTIVLDFGEEGCRGVDGRLRKGKISMNYIGSLNPGVDNATIITFENYSVDGNTLNGQLSTTKWAFDPSSGNISSQLTATQMSLEFAEDETTFAWNGLWNRTIPFNPDNAAPITYQLTGQSSGITREGREFISTISEDLVYKLECATQGIPYAAEGNRSIIVNARIPITINIGYGNGTCDKNITVAVNGQTENYTLP